MDDQLIDVESITMDGAGPRRRLTVEFSALDEAATIDHRFRVAAEIAKGLMACWRGDDDA